MGESQRTEREKKKEIKGVGRRERVSSVDQGRRMGIERLEGCLAGVKGGDSGREGEDKGQHVYI